ncbi:MAG: glycosyltransferase, partial [Planctomycetaceae bacterium]|nr:glycosyltransferase [Planctomycetaceae bacterium]
SQSEGAPVAVREAMACNLPIVSVDVGDVASVIGTTDNCAIVNTEPEVIANSIAQILRTEKRSNGRNSATEMSVRTFAQSVANIYEQVGTRKKPVEFKSKITTFPAETKN